MKRAIIWKKTKFHDQIYQQATEDVINLVFERVDNLIRVRTP